MGKMPHSLLVFLTICAAVSWTPAGARVIHKRAAFYIANDTMCIVDGDVYRNGDPVPTDDECERCTCRPPGFSCVLRDCDTKPGCKAVRRAGECCPEYVCGCVHNNRVYEDGEIIKDLQNACYTCRCHGSSISCTFADCLFRSDCPPEYVPGECCPRYDHCPPLSTTPSSTIFTTESTTQSANVQQNEIFVNLTTQYLEKFTSDETTLTVIDILPSSSSSATTTTTTTSPKDVTSSTIVSVKFILTDGTISSISDIEATTLSTLLHTQTVKYTDTTRYSIPDPASGVLTTTQISSSSVNDGDSSREKEATSTTSLTKEITEANTTTQKPFIADTTTVSVRKSSSELNASEDISEVDNLYESHVTEEINEKFESVSQDDKRDHMFPFDEISVHNKTTNADIVDVSFSSTMLYEQTQVFDGEELQTTLNLETSSDLSEISELHYSTTKDEENMFTTTQKFGETDESHTRTVSTNGEIGSSTGKISDVTKISVVTEPSTTITSYSEVYTDDSTASTKAPIGTEFINLHSSTVETFDAEETPSTENLNSLFVATTNPESYETTDISYSTNETLFTEKPSQPPTILNPTELHLFVETATEESDVFGSGTVETTETPISTEIHEEGKYFSTERSTENVEVSHTPTWKVSTKMTNEDEEWFTEHPEKSSDSTRSFVITKHNFTEETKGETEFTDEWKETSQHSDSLGYQTLRGESNEKETQHTDESLEYSHETEIFTKHNGFTESISLLPDINTGTTDTYNYSSTVSFEGNLSTLKESESDGSFEIYSKTSKPQTSANELNRESSVSNNIHEITETELTTTHSDLSKEISKDVNVPEFEHFNNSFSTTILDGETFSDSEATESFGSTFIENVSLTKNYQNTTFTSDENNTAESTDSSEVHFADELDLEELSTHSDQVLNEGNNTILSENTATESITDSVSDGTRFTTETVKIEASSMEGISESISVFNTKPIFQVRTNITNEISEPTISTFLQSNEYTDPSLVESSHSSFDELIITADPTNYSDQSSDSPEFQEISSNATDSHNILIYKPETEMISGQVTNGLNDVSTTEGSIAKVSNEMENSVSTSIESTEDIQESETLQSNFDTIVNILQTTKIGFDDKLSQNAIKPQVTELPESQTESEETTNSKYDLSTKNDQANGSKETNFDNTLKNHDLDFANTAPDVTFSTHPTTEISKDGETSQLFTSSTNDTNDELLSLVGDVIKVDEKVNISSKIQEHDFMHIPEDTDAVTANIFTQSNNTSFSLNNDIYTLSPDGLNDLDTFTTDSTPVENENLVSEINGAINSNFTNGMTISVLDIEQSHAEISTKNILNNTESSTFTISLPSDAENNESNFSNTSSDVQNATSLFDDDYSILDSEEDDMAEVFADAIHNSKQPLEIEINDSMSSEETGLNSANISLNYTTVGNVFDVKDSLTSLNYSYETNSKDDFSNTEEQSSLSTSKSFTSINSDDFTNTSSKYSENEMLNFEHAENKRSNSSTLELESTTTKDYTSSSEQVSVQNIENNFYLDNASTEIQTNGKTHTISTFTEKDYSLSTFQTSEVNSTYNFDFDEITSSTNEATESQIIYSNKEELPSGIENDNHNFSQENSEVLIKNIPSSSSPVEIPYDEIVLGGSESSLLETGSFIERNFTNFVDVPISNQNTTTETLDKLDLETLSTLSEVTESSYKTSFVSGTPDFQNNEQGDTSVTQINDSDDKTTVKVQILFGQSSEQIESLENSTSDIVTPKLPDFENDENKSIEDNSTNDDNTYGVAMHESGDDNGKFSTNKLTSPSIVSENTEVNHSEDKLDYENLEFDSEEETTETYNANVTKPSVSYRVETARNLDDSTTSDHLALTEESSSLSYTGTESIVNLLVSSTQTDGKYFNNKWQTTKLADDLYEITTTTYTLSDDVPSASGYFGDNFHKLNVKSSVITPDDLNTVEYTELTTQNGINFSEETKIYDLNEKKNVTKNNSSGNSNIPKNSYEAHGYLGGVYITGNSKYQKNVNEILRSPDNQTTTANDEKASGAIIIENSQKKLHSEGNILTDSEDIVRLESEKEKEISLESETTTVVQHFSVKSAEEAIKTINVESPLDEPKNLTESDLESLSAITANVKNLINSSPSLLTNKSETSDKQHLQIPIDNFEKAGGPEKGGEWLEPTSPTNIAALLNSDLSLQNEAVQSDKNSGNDSISFVKSKQEQNGPEKGGEFFEPTIPNVLHSSNKTDEKGNFGPVSSDAVVTEISKVENGITFATTLPTYVLLRGKENSNKVASNPHVSINSEFEDHENITLINDVKTDDTEINAEESAVKKDSRPLPFSLQDQNETTLESDYSLSELPTKSEDDVLFSPETQESNITSNVNNSIITTEENKMKFLQPYSLIDVISTVFKAPGYDSEVHTRFLKEQVNYSKKEKPLSVVKRNAYDSTKDKTFEIATSVNSEATLKTSNYKKNPYILQTKNVYNQDSSLSKINNMRQGDPPPAKVTSSFIFVIHSDNRDLVESPTWIPTSSVHEAELSDNYPFSQQGVTKTKN